MIKNIAWLLLVVLIIIQFISIDKTNPPVNPSQDFLTISQPPQEMARLIKDACYDCHSNTTKFPWYTNIQPVAWWVKNHIENGRKELNFSTWATYKNSKKIHKLEECAELTEATEMPLLSYILMHPEAKISEEERAAMVKWFTQQATLNEETD